MNDTGSSFLRKPPLCFDNIFDTYFILGVETTRRFLLEWLSFLHRYVPVGILEKPPQRMNERVPEYHGKVHIFLESHKILQNLPLTTAVDTVKSKGKIM